jgi:hypothetical protein
MLYARIRQQKIIRHSNQNKIHAVALIMQVEEDATQCISIMHYQQQGTSEDTPLNFTGNKFARTITWIYY